MEGAAEGAFRVRERVDSGSLMVLATGRFRMVGRAIPAVHLLQVRSALRCDVAFSGFAGP
jgi:hypothetical protein